MLLVVSGTCSSGVTKAFFNALWKELEGLNSETRLATAEIIDFDAPTTGLFSQNSSDLNTIVSTENSLMEPDSKVPSNIVGLEEFSLTDTKNDNKEQIDADSLFSFPDTTKE
mgnify:CR=1 FL=1